MTLTCSAQSDFDDEFNFEWRYYCDDGMNFTYVQTVEPVSVGDDTSTISYFTTPPNCYNSIVCIAFEASNPYYNYVTLPVEVYGK